MPVSTGFAAPEYQGVRAHFDSFLGDDPEYSAQLAVYQSGNKVLDLSGGPHLASDSITGAYSCSKGVAAFVIGLLVQDGILDLDLTVAHYWPEFAAEGKAAITVRQALSHRAGLLGLEGGFALSEFTTADAAVRLAAAAPLWRPGATFGYHALTIGIIMEELCRRVAGSTLQELYDARIRVPFGVDFFLGLPEDQEPRYRDVLYDADILQPWLDPLGLEGLNGNAAISTVMELPNHRVIRQYGMSGAGGVGSADGLARLYAAATTGVDGGDAFLAADTVRTMSEEQVWGLDRASGLDNAFAIVFMKPHPSRNFGSHRAFGHEGANAALGFADPAYDLAYGYIPGRQEEGRTPGRAHRLAHAVRQVAASIRQAPAARAYS
ncbi:serine hydrolase domain-containing protein [Arthrobacter oryzae]|jgi:CubicO group peptidase (beta-lactamase class C family)|uniref:serine hydrolase domain-containing protein n=1 Tax=Arthrobacter oryzae TaxID=409290 RepID=UPI002783B30A|nr:serine hydrolase domain-containing protein [Arthrobacter oryzae]MDQ0075791.1 CubicO group peptidase (beta-lactamase class C family) [Arthrobacter oryzae]